MISKYFTSDVKFVNNAMGGRSSRNFVTEGRLNKMLNTIQRGDYLFVQFGHNDATSNNIDCFTDPFTKYKEYLSKYIDGAREKDAIPVLITPAAQLNYSAGT
jgi:lysophospholipase L1-like esterase